MITIKTNKESKNNEAELNIDKGTPHNRSWWRYWLWWRGRINEI